MDEHTEILVKHFIVPIGAATAAMFAVSLLTQTSPLGLGVVVGVVVLTILKPPWRKI